jgi:cytochrome c-type biogenesis protein CcmI
MDWLPAALGAFLVACAAAFALLPLVRGTSQPTSITDAAAFHRFDIYRQVVELEFDHQVGKLSTEDYRQLSAELLSQAGQSLRDQRDDLAELDAEIEREIAAARAAFAAARSAHAERPAGTPS